VQIRLGALDVVVKVVAERLQHRNRHGRRERGGGVLAKR
jgi:hypothetical protein